MQSVHPRRKKIKLGNLAPASASAGNNQSSYLKFIEPQMQSQQTKIKKLCQLNYQTQSQTSQIQERVKAKKHLRKIKYEVQLDIKESENEEQSQEKKIQKAEKKEQTKQVDEVYKEPKQEINLKNLEVVKEQATINTTQNQQVEEKQPEAKQQNLFFKPSVIEKTENFIEKPVSIQNCEPTKGLFFNSAPKIESSLFMKQNETEKKEEKKDEPIQEIKLFGTTTQFSQQTEKQEPVKIEQQLSELKEEGEEEEGEITNNITNNQEVKSKLFSFEENHINEIEAKQKQKAIENILSKINNNEAPKFEGLFNFAQQNQNTENKTINNNSSEQSKGRLFGNLASIVPPNNNNSGDQAIQPTTSMLFGKQSSSNPENESKPTEIPKALTFSDLTKKQNQGPLFNTAKTETSMSATIQPKNKTEFDIESNPFAMAAKPANSNQPPSQNSLFGSLFNNQPPTTGSLFNQQSPVPTLPTQQPSSLFGNSFPQQSFQPQSFQPLSNNSGLFSGSNSQMQVQAMTLFQPTEQIGTNFANQPSLFDNNSGKNSAQGKDSVNNKQRTRNNKMRVNDM